MAPLRNEGARGVVQAVADLVTLLEPRLIGLWKVTGLTLSQRRVLWRLRDERMSAGDLADVLGLSPPSLTRLLTKLEDRGFIVRILDRTDRRRILVDLTAEGRRALTNYQMFAGSSLSRAARGLDASEQREVAGAIALLVRLAREIEEREPGD